MEKRAYLQPDARWIELISRSVIAESEPGTEDDETTPLTFSGKAKNAMNKDSYTY